VFYLTEASQITGEVLHVMAARIWVGGD